MQQIDDIAAEVRRGARIGDAEAARLWREAPLWLLGELATECKRRVSGDKVYFNRNFHIEPTNRCVFTCRFCTIRRYSTSIRCGFPIQSGFCVRHLRLLLFCRRPRRRRRFCLAAG